MSVQDERKAVRAEAHAETADIETSSDDYARRFEGAVGRWMLDVQAQWVLEMLRGQEGGRLLDVGGGHGQLSAPLAQAGFDVTVLGSDQVCERRIAKDVAAGRVRFVAGSVLELPFDDRAFDVVVSVRLLPHCEAWERLLAELCRVAATSVLVDYPTPQSLNAVAPLFFGAKKRMEGNTRTWRSFRHEEVARIVRKEGFEVTGRRGQFFWPMVLHRMLGQVRLSKGLEGAAGMLGLRTRWGSPVILCAKREGG